jgi:hypothetical protein
MSGPFPILAGAPALGGVYPHPAATAPPLTGPDTEADRAAAKAIAASQRAQNEPPVAASLAPGGKR